jgi:hypothetical protein
MQSVLRLALVSITVIFNTVVVVTSDSSLSIVKFNLCLGRPIYLVPLDVQIKASFGILVGIIFATFSFVSTVSEHQVAGFPLRPPRFDAKSGHVGFVVDEEELGHTFSEYFDFPCQF